MPLSVLWSCSCSRRAYHIRYPGFVVMLKVSVNDIESVRHTFLSYFFILGTPLHLGCVYARVQVSPPPPTRRTEMYVQRPTANRRTHALHHGDPLSPFACTHDRSGFSNFRLDKYKVVGQRLVFSTPRGGDLEHKVGGDLKGGAKEWRSPGGEF